MADVASLEAEVKEFKLQLETVQTSLQGDPSNQELLSLQSELEEFISLTEQSIAELRPQKKTPSSSATTNVGKESYRGQAAEYAQTQPQTQAQVQQVHTEQVLPFNVNDTVLARWVSGDGAYYPAKITSVTGSKANPKYIVRFKEYNNVETLSAKDVKPISSAATTTTTTTTTTPTTTTGSPIADQSATHSLKRKAELSSANISPPPPPPPSHSAGIPPPPSAASTPAAPPPPPRTIISAEADINPALASAARSSSGGTGHGQDRPAKAPKRARANKELEKGKAKWQEFANKNKFAKKGAGKKDSMFRTGEGVGARVGFTGSGQQMRKDPARTKHIYQRQDEDD